MTLLFGTCLVTAADTLLGTQVQQCNQPRDREPLVSGRRLQCHSASWQNELTKRLVIGARAGLLTGHKRRSCSFVEAPRKIDVSKSYRLRERRRDVLGFLARSFNTAGNVSSCEEASEKENPKPEVHQGFLFVHFGWWSCTVGMIQSVSMCVGLAWKMMRLEVFPWRMLRRSSTNTFRILLRLKQLHTGK